MSLRSEFAYLESLPPWQCARFVLYAVALGAVISFGLWKVTHSQAQLDAATNALIKRAQVDPFGALYMIHKPKSGCPAGWVIVPKRFIEGDGAMRDACFFNTTSPLQVSTEVDYLLPKEMAWL